MPRTLLLPLGGLLLTLSVAAGAPSVVAARPSSSGAGAPVVEYAPPLPGPLRVLTPFDPPATPYGPGHRGVDLAAAQGAQVSAAGSGVVSFAGSVAGRGVVVVVHPDGISTEYEPVRPVVHNGDAVSVGTLLGIVDGAHAACAPASCLHWGARRDGVYLDPLDLLRALGPVRLLPWRG